MALTNLNISPILREIGDKGWDTKALVNGHPLLTSLERDTSAMSGDYYKVPIQYANPSGRSKLVATAYAAEAGSKYAAFKVTPISNYLHFRLDGLVVRKAENSSDRTSFVDALKQEVFSALQAMGDDLARDAYGNVGGARGRVHPTTAISTTSLTLANPSDAVFFAAGMRIQASDTDGTTGSLRASGAFVTLVSVDLNTGVLVADGNWSTITGITNNDYLFQAGDFGLGAAGLEAWNPGTVTSTAFYGVDRTVDPSFLGGMRFNGVTSGDSMETVFISADAVLGLQKGNPFNNAEVFINPISMGSLRVAKEGQRFIDDDNEYQIGIKKFRTPSGHVLVEDRDCPVGIARVVSKGAFWMMTNGEVPALADTDGITMRYDDSADRYLATVVGDYNFGAKPQGLARILLPTA